jgi:pimeloyl-ACP methyl ester carboxylesterase
MSFKPKPLAIAVPESELAGLKSRLKQTRYPDAVAEAGWDYGTDLGFLKRLVGHWAEKFDWRAEEKRLNGFSHHTVEIEHETVHYVHAKGNGGKRVPLLIANGWPSNFVELLPLVPLLTREIDGISFDLVLPSLPGFGYSGKAKQKGMTLTRTAELWQQLMTGLGYDRFLVSGSDLGAGAELSLVKHFPERLLGAHWCNVYSQFQRPEKPTKEEQDYFQRVDMWQFTEAAYAMEQGTKPTTLAVGLNDSPAGLAAWIIEKFHTWGDTGGNVESVFSLDTLCSILSVYWFTETIGSSVRLYKEAFADRDITQPPPKHDVPSGVLIPAECDMPAPRAWGERHLQNLVHWTVLDKGGHFPALEVPDALAGDIRAFYAGIAK